jgi:hypothetical protein
VDTVVEVKLADWPWVTVLGEGVTVGAASTEFTVTVAAEEVTEAPVASVT